MARTDVTPLRTARWHATRSYVAHRASFRCEHCFVYLGMAGDVDHIVPRSEIDMCGIGVFDPSNLQYLCQSCHASKTGRERWAGHVKRGPRLPGRSQVQGRQDFLEAAGITHPKGKQ